MLMRAGSVSRELIPGILIANENNTGKTLNVGEREVDSDMCEDNIKR